MWFRKRQKWLFDERWPPPNLALNAAQQDITVTSGGLDSMQEDSIISKHRHPTPLETSLPMKFSLITVVRKPSYTSPDICTLALPNMDCEYFWTKKKLRRETF